MANAAWLGACKNGVKADRPDLGGAPTPKGDAALPRKEVIQPQLPLRLPCYDFVPITRPTLDRCLCCQLAHGLQVLPAFVT